MAHQIGIKIMQMPKFTSTPALYSTILNYRKNFKKLRFLCRNAPIVRKPAAILPLKLLFYRESGQNRIIFLKVSSEFGTITALAGASG
jgi:hypothetical protein